MKLHIECEACQTTLNESAIEYNTFICDPECGCEGYEFSLDCHKCGNEIYTGSSYGEFDLEEAIDEIVEHFNPKEVVKSKSRGFMLFGDSIGHGGEY